MLPLVGACGINPAAVGPSMEESPGTGRVVLLNVEGLESPPVARSQLFRAASFFGIDSDADVKATGFTLTVAADAAGSTRARLVDAQARRGVELLEVSGDLPASGPWDSAVFVAASQQARDALRGGSGVFTIKTLSATDTTVWQRLGVVLPETILSRMNRLTVFRRETGGVPLGGAEIEIVREFFHLAVIGDSIVWGNGLRRDDTIPALVAAGLEAELGVRVIMQHRAQNGATLAASDSDRPCTGVCWGEVPRTATSIPTQFASLDRPESIDLILFSGCINDVGLSTLLDPFIDENSLSAATESACQAMMAEFLRDVRTVAPQARVVVLGLYPLVSAQSDLFGVDQLRRIVAPEAVPIVDGLIGALAETSRVFAASANAAIVNAVNDVNSLPPGPSMIACAIPDFGPPNAVFGPESWLWNMTPDNSTLMGLEVGLELLPEDPMAAIRWRACLEHGPALDLILCMYSSVGHPNPAGANAYADAVVRALRALGVLPAG